MTKLSSSLANILLSIFVVLSFSPMVVSSSPLKKDPSVLVQLIGELSENERLIPAIEEEVRIVPFSKEIDASSTAIIIISTLTHLESEENRAIEAAYRGGRAIIILDASAHDIEALHVLLGEGVIYGSITDPVLSAYVLRKENSIPKAMVLTKVRSKPKEVSIPEDEELAFAREIDILVEELQLFEEAYPLNAGFNMIAGGTVNWMDSPVQSTIMAVNSSSGIYNTTVNVYALHECAVNRDQYVVTAESDWTPTHARYQSARTEFESTISAGFDDIVGPGKTNWQDNRDHCKAGDQTFNSGENICRYVNYPLQYSMKIEPPKTGTTLQVKAAPGATQGTATSYSSGVTINIGGGVNISGMGPSAGIQAGVSWNNTTSVSVPAMLVKAGDTPNEGATWDYVYCTSGDSSDNCVSHVQMKGTGICVDFELGDAQNGQTPGGRFSATGQSVQFEADPDTRVGESFDIDVTFTADMATTETRLWNGKFINAIGDVTSGFNGYCNIFDCSCSNQTTKHPVTLTHTFKIPFPSTQCPS